MTRLIRWASPVALACLALAATTPAQAAVNAKSGTIEVVTGWYFPDNQPGKDPHDDFTYGARGGFNFTRHFGMQGAVQVFDTSVEMPAPIADTTINSLMVDLSFEWLVNPDSRAVFELYGGPGYAWQSINPNGPKNTDDDDVITAHVGVGTKISVAKNFYIRPGASVHWFDADENPAGPGKDDSHTDWDATVAFGWYLGGE